ncbi:MAG: thermonuclease family protein [candidate division Zixibacteria bacterium]|nr:thermonuclease family protein [candidate division Zixibacteria bacterium]
MRLGGTLVFIIIVALLALFRFVEETADKKLSYNRFSVTKIIDGDTVELEGGDRLRLQYIDSPERGEPYADSATILLKTLLIGVANAQSPLIDIIFGQRKRDGYGRLLGDLRVGGMSVSEELLRRGFANVYLFRDRGGKLEDSLSRRLIEAQRDAILRRAGKWSLIFSEEAEYLSPGRSLRFHRPTCASISRSNRDAIRRYGSRFEALIEGLSPCRNCRP